MRFFLKNKALFAMLVAATLITARWVWIVRKNGDFGMTYEIASRISKGEVYGRDFFFCVSPLACYGEALLVRILGGSVWSHQISLFGWWYVALGVGYLLARKWTDDQDLLAAGGVMAVMVSAPFSTCGQSYNYTVTALLGLSAWLYTRHQQNRSGRSALVLSGVLAGLGILAKQNVGAAFVLFLLGFLALDSVALSRPGFGRTVANAALLLGGVALGFGVPFLALASQSGAANLLRHLFLDGVSEKGGVLIILIRVLPRFSVSDLVGTAHHRLVEGAISAVLLLALLGFGVRKLLLLKKTPEEMPSVAWPSRKLAVKHLVVLTAIGLFSAVSLLNFPALAEMGGKIASLFLIKSVGFGLSLGQIFYFVCFAAFGLVTAFQLFGARKTLCSGLPVPGQFRVELFLILAACALSAAPLTSGIMYFSFAAPVAIPILACVLKKHFRMSLSRLNLATITFALLAYLYPSYATTFCRYEPLPSNSPFAGLYAAKHQSDMVWQMWNGVHPLVNGRTTLWLVKSGPSSAYGGLSVPNVVPIDNTHTVKTQEVLANIWSRHLPERVVVDPTLFQSPSGLLPRDSYYFTARWIFEWLGKHYTKIYEDHLLDQDIEVWALRAGQPANSSHLERE